MVEVSVIIPVYNEENYIEKCLSSLLSQTYKNLEIIVVDDGSTDNTVKIIKSFKKVSLLKGEHKGPGFSRNLGAKQAKGKILVFVDADMTFEKDYIKNLISPMLENSSVIGTTHDYEVATNTHKPSSLLWGRIRVSPEHAHEVKIFRAIRRSNFLDMGGFDPKYGYADDQTFYYKYNITPNVAKGTTCFHRNPETIKETYKQAIWIGRSWKRRFPILKIPILNWIAFLVIGILTIPKIILKSIASKIAFKSISLRFIVKFYSVKFYGYLVGLYTSLLFDEVRK